VEYIYYLAISSSDKACLVSTIHNDAQYHWNS